MVGERPAGVDLGLLDDPRQRHHALSHHLLEESAQDARVLRVLAFGHEGPAPLLPQDQATLFQPAECLTHGHPADPDLLRQLALARQAHARFELATVDAVGQLLLDLEVGGEGPHRRSHPRRRGERIPQRRGGDRLDGARLSRVHASLPSA